MDPSIRLWFLGAPRAEVAGQPIRAFESRKAFALLAYLASHGTTIPRAQLAALFWPDHSDDRARTNLRSLLRNLTSVLPGCVAVDRQTVGLTGTPACWIDTAAFEQLAAQHTLTSLTAAADLYRNAFLDGLYLDTCPELETWLTQQREHWHERAVYVLTELTARAHKRQEWSAGLQSVDRLLALDPWREAAHQDKMRLLALSGQRDSALAQYEICRRVLADELGIDPSPETTALYEQIRDNLLQPPALPPQPQSSLPHPPTALVGRADELAQITPLLAQPDCRLLTVLGPGGVGKTRLTLALAAEMRNTFADIFFVDLTSVSDASMVPDAIARTLVVREAPNQSLLASIQDRLRDAPALLVLDNFEHVAAAAPLVADLLAGCAHLRVVATSRQELHLRGEQVFPLSPLALPDLHAPPDLAHLANSAAVALFVERARHQQPSFTLSDSNAAAVVEICRRLDGLPLAIELAAARVRLFPPAALVQRLSHRLDLLTRGPHDLPMRQQTLQNTLDWSYTLLEEREQALFAHLAVFVGGWTLEAAERVCDDGSALIGDILDVLQGLLDKQLVRQELRADGWPHFTMLETIHEYALARLVQRGDELVFRRRHAAYYLDLVEPAAFSEQDQSEGALLTQIEAEYDNVRAALRWLLERNDGESSVRMVKALQGFWQSRGHVREARRWLREALALPAPVASAIRADALAAASGFAVMQGDWTEAVTFLEQALIISRPLGNTRHITRLLSLQGWLALTGGKYQEATRLLEESLALYDSLGDRHGIALALGYLGQAAYEQAAFAVAIPLLEESLAISRTLDDHIAVGWSLNKLGLVALYRSEMQAAARLLEESLRTFTALEHTGGMAWARGCLGWVHLHYGDEARAAELFIDSLKHYSEVGDKRNSAFGLERMACLASVQGQAARAARLFGAATTLRETNAVPLPPADRAHYAQYGMISIEDGLPRAQEAAWAAGAALTTEQAVADALQPGCTHKQLRINDEGRA